MGQEFRKTAAGAEAAFVNSYGSLELLAIDGLKSGLPSSEVGPKLLIFHTFRGSVLILRERDLSLQRPLQDNKCARFVHNPFDAEEFVFGHLLPERLGCALFSI